MDQQWIVKSLTIWGVIIALLTAMAPALGLAFPELAGTITPEWLAALDVNIKTTVTSVGVLIGSVMVLVDRLSGTGEVKKTLTLRKPEYWWND